MHAAPADPAGPTADRPPVPGAGYALFLLILINLFNYLDRNVLNAVEPKIREEFFAVRDPETKQPVIDPATGKMKETEDAKSLMGLLAFAFLVTYMLTAPLFGWLATRMSRWLLIGLGILVWSLASGASGLAPHAAESAGWGYAPVVFFGAIMPAAYLVMLATRCLVGLGEAVYGPVAPDVISDLYPVSQRGKVLAWFYAAIPVGSALGYVLGAAIADKVNWQYAFYVVVPPGVVLAVWCWFMKEPPRGTADGPTHKATWGDYLFILRTPSYALNTAGMTFMCFAMGGLAFWAPGYLDSLGKQGKVGPVFGLEPTMFFGILTAGLGLVATLLGGMVGDRLRDKVPGAYFVVSGVGMLVGAPMLVAMVYTPFPLAWVFLGVFIFCLFFNTGPTNAINANVVHPLLRPTGFALNILVIHLLGDALSPTIMGYMIGAADRYDIAFTFVSVTVFVGGILWLWGARYLERDTLAAPTRLPAA